MKKIVTETKTVIINTKTNEQFVSASQLIDITTGKEVARFELTRADGTTKEVAASTFKRWYKTTEVQVETEVEAENPTVEKPKAETRYQQNAISNIEGAYTDIIGGYENSVQDGYISEMPPIEELFEEVYANAMDSAHMMFGGLRMDGGPAPICMRFAGKAFVKKYIAYLFTEEGYEVPENLYNTPKRKALPHSRNMEIPGNLSKGEVIMRAFTGMYIGVFQVVEETDSIITIMLKDGTSMKFDSHTGKQLYASKSQFANYIQW